MAAQDDVFTVRGLVKHLRGVLQRKTRPMEVKQQIIEEFLVASREEQRLATTEAVSSSTAVSSFWSASAPSRTEVEDEVNPETTPETEHAVMGAARLRRMKRKEAEERVKLPKSGLTANQDAKRRKNNRFYSNVYFESKDKSKVEP
eukprot:TRINITY_DN78500_c0_g1_i1.p1 TRINITY_DN78500_c0_g1~~TRINITY_DN78500_c0_g1_i1.p1  ORF type:complete len:162 (-),score=37.62 TRINITY_DN78500_c0_g1_i1:76-513(-)